MISGRAVSIMAAVSSMVSKRVSSFFPRWPSLSGAMSLRVGEASQLFRRPIAMREREREREKEEGSN